MTPFDEMVEEGVVIITVKLEDVSAESSILFDGVVVAIL